MSDPLGRKHQTVRKPTNRPAVDHVCNYVLIKAKDEFYRKPSVKHVYYNAYLVIFGSEAAALMLADARDAK